MSGYYNQLQLVEEFLLHERELSLETDVNKSFFEAWEKESESTLIFLQKNGQAISAGGTKMRIDMPSKLLLDLKNGYNIGKLVRLDYDQKKKDGYLVAIPCQEYTCLLYTSSRIPYMRPNVLMRNVSISIVSDMSAIAVL